MPVPLFDTRTPVAPLLPAIQAKVGEVIEASQFILGPELEAFERELADYLGTRHAIGVGNGTDAITLVLRALLEGLIRAFGIDVGIEVDRARLRRVDQPRFFTDVSRLRADTGWEPEHQLDDTLAALADFWRRRIAAGAPH